MRGKRLLLCVALLVACQLMGLGCQKAQAPTLEMTVLDVGQSDCILLTQGAHRMLIDTGSAAAHESLAAELALRGVERLDCVLITHPHEDHFGNARYILESCTVGRLFVCEGTEGDQGYALLLSAAKALGVPVQSLYGGEVFSLGEATCTALVADAQDGNVNNDSILLRVLFGSAVLLFTGDAESGAESALLARYGASFLDCDFLKVGHHGSDTATSAAFVQALTPQCAAISCGRYNEYGFPHQTVLDNLQDAGAQVYRTDLLGTLEFVCDGTNITYRQ